MTGCKSRNSLTLKCWLRIVYSVGSHFVSMFRVSELVILGILIEFLLFKAFNNVTEWSQTQESTSSIMTIL